MDNNPFRNNQPNNNGNTGYMTPTMGGQPQQQQQQQQPYGAGGYSSAAYPQQQPQQPWQSNTTTPNTPYSPLQAQNTSFTSLPQQNTYSSPTPPPFNSSNNQPQQQYSSPYNNTSSLMSSAPSIGGSSGVLGGGGNTYQPYQGSTTMPTPNVYNGNVGGGYNAGYGGIQTQPQQQQSPYGSNNFYIPANFGQSTTPSNTNTNMFQPQQPRHAPVDASSLLKGTQVKRVECPVCQKTIEGDDMAVNHHVNEHYS
jgi:hypothetical protein